MSDGVMTSHFLTLNISKTVLDKSSVSNENV